MHRIVKYAAFVCIIGTSLHNVEKSLQTGGLTSYRLAEYDGEASVEVVGEQEDAMSLNWYVANIKDSDDVCWMTATKNAHYDGRVRGEEYLHPITNTLIWATMAIGLSEITAKNLDEWEARFALAYKTGWMSPLSVWNGEPVGPDGKNAHCFTERYITRADLEQHIGLSTNANDESASAWRKRVVERLTEEGIREGKRNAEENVGIDAIWQKEGIELRNRIRSGETTKEKEALPESQPAD